MEKIIKYNKIFLGITLVMVLAAIAMIYYFGLRVSIDFKGGTIFEYSGNTDKIEEVKNEFSFKYNETLMSGSNKKLIFESLVEDDQKKVLAKIAEKYPEAKKVSVETITSEVGIEQTKNAIYSVAFASIGIIVFLAIAFRSIPKPFSSWEFGGAAVIALLHDGIIVVGVFAFLTKYYSVHIDLLFITAILTVIGFSVHDTIVVFDRLRENLMNSLDVPYKTVIQISLQETVVRSIILTLTAVIVLIALLFLGPVNLKWFTMALLIGMVSGTYSSIFVATQLLIVWQEVKTKFLK